MRRFVGIALDEYTLLTSRRFRADAAVDRPGHPCGKCLYVRVTGRSWRIAGCGKGQRIADRCHDVGSQRLRPCVRSWGRHVWNRVTRTFLCGLGKVVGHRNAKPRRRSVRLRPSSARNACRTKSATRVRRTRMHGSRTMGDGRTHLAHEAPSTRSIWTVRGGAQSPMPGCRSGRHDQVWTHTLRREPA